MSELRKENDELLRSIQKVNEKLQDSERFKGHFISNITNEIVNPFSSVLALAENIRHLNESEIGVAHRLADLIYEEAFHLDFQLKNIFAAAMIEAGNGGSIILTASIAGLQAFANLAHYVSAKHGVVGLMRALSVELAPHGIRCNTVNPTLVDTDMIHNRALYELFLAGNADASREEAAA